VENFAKKIPADARLCFNEQFEAASQDRKGKSCFKLPALDNNNPFANIEIVKCYSLKKDILTVTYMLKNSGGKPEKFCFLPEIDFSFAGEGEEFVRFFAVDGGGKDALVSSVLKNNENLKILDIKNEAQILLNSSQPFSGCITTAKAGELYQATRIMPRFGISLESEETWTNEFSLKFSH
jgi:hypothetical protein